MEQEQLLPLDAACTLPADVVARDFAASERIGRHRVGARAVYLDRGFDENPLRYVPIESIDAVQRRSFPVKRNG